MSLISRKQAASAREGSILKKREKATRSAAATRALGPYLRGALQAACEGYPGVEVDAVPEHIVAMLADLGYKYTAGKRSFGIEERLQHAQTAFESNLDGELKQAVRRGRRIGGLLVSFDDSDALPPVRNLLSQLRQLSSEMLDWPEGTLWASVPSLEEMATFTRLLQEREQGWHARRLHLEARLAQARRAPTKETSVHAHDWPLLQSWVKQGHLSLPASWALWKVHIGDEGEGALSIAELQRVIRKDPRPLLRQLSAAAINRVEDAASTLTYDLRGAEKKLRSASSQIAIWSQVERFVGAMHATRSEMGRAQAAIRTLQRRLAGAPPPASPILSWGRASKSLDGTDELMTAWLMRWLSSESGQKALKTISRAIQSEARRGGSTVTLGLTNLGSAWSIGLNERSIAGRSPLTPASLKLVLRQHGYQVASRVSPGKAKLEIYF
jgi:hypothetical protein